MSEQDFLKAIRANPGDESHCHAYIKWLDAQGDPRATLIRLSQGVPTCKAIISDIHSNLEALQAVLADIAACNIRQVYCLGDIVGYGPNPCECLDLVQARCALVLLGNHDQAVLAEPDRFTESAQRALIWTRTQLQTAGSSQDSARRLQFLGGLPVTHQEDDFLFVHASPQNPLEEYVFPEDVYNEWKLNRIFEQMPRWCFHGHTHVPGLLTADRCWHDPSSFGTIFHLDRRKTLCNVGSVGQPRDGDWRASYVLLVGQTVHFRRVEYDIRTTTQKIGNTPELGGGR